MDVLVLGDTHIPTRADDLPDWVKEFVERGWDLIVHTGDVEEGWVLEYLSHFGELVAVRGNMDFLPLPESQLINTDLGTALILHGHQVRPRGNREALADLGKKFGAQVVISGHTHTPFVERIENILLLNPGTATGAWGGSYEGGRQSILTIEGSEVKLWVNGKAER